MLSFLLILNLPPTNSWFFVKIFRGIGDNWTKPNFTEDSKGCLVRVVFNQVEKNNSKVIFDESSLQRWWGKNIPCGKNFVNGFARLQRYCIGCRFEILLHFTHFCPSLFTDVWFRDETYISDGQRSVYNGHHYSANWWGFIFLKDMFVFLSLRCFSQMIFLERFSSLLIFPSPSTLILAISNIKVSFYLPGA